MLLLVAAGLVGMLCQFQAQGAPRLVVVLVVDQMRADYLKTFERHWKGGVRTLLAEGRVFDNARYPYLGTVTCAGHSTIGTGALPHTHGMINNVWLERETGRTVGCTTDPDSPDIGYGRQTRQADSARRMLVPTLADALRAQKPGAKVVTMSLKARSAIGLAGHGGDAVTWFDEAAGTWATSRAYAAAPVAAVKTFIDANPIESDLGRSWTLSGPPDSYIMRDAGIGEAPPRPWSGLFPHVITGRNGTDPQFIDLWERTPLADAYLARMAESLVDTLALGQDETTDYLGIGFSVLDEVGHSFGPQSREVEEVLRQLDATLQGLIAQLDARVGRANYVLALSADHGVAPIAVAPTGGRIFNEDVRERIEETLLARLGPSEGSYVAASNFTDVSLAPGVFDRLKTKPDAMAALEHALREIPGIERVLRGDQLSADSSDPAVRAAALSYYKGRSGDLILVPRKYWYFSGRGGSGTTHGTLHEYDQRVPLIFLGGTVTRGHDSRVASPADIAPTLAGAIGIQLPKAEGRNLLK